MYTCEASFPKTLVDRPVEDEAYIPQPYLKELIELYKWMCILANLDTCALITQI